MPKPPVKETRRPELRLPEIKRDEIVRALSEIRLPDVDLSKVDWSRLDLSKLERPKMELPDVNVSRGDIRRAMEGAAIRAGVRERTRSRWPVLAGLAIAAGIGVWALLRRPAVRAQVADSAKKARARLDQMRIERESETPTPERIEAAVGIVEDGLPTELDESGPSGGTIRRLVAVGPGRILRRRRTAVMDESPDEAFSDAGDTMTDVEGEALPAFEEASSAS